MRQWVGWPSYRWVNTWWQPWIYCPMVNTPQRLPDWNALATRVTRTQRLLTVFHKQHTGGTGTAKTSPDPSSGGTSKTAPSKRRGRAKWNSPSTLLNTALARGKMCGESQNLDWKIVWWSLWIPQSLWFWEKPKSRHEPRRLPNSDSNRENDGWNGIGETLTPSCDALREGICHLGCCHLFSTTDAHAALPMSQSSNAAGYGLGERPSWLSQMEGNLSGAPQLNSGNSDSHNHAAWFIRRLGCYGLSKDTPTIVGAFLQSLVGK